MKDEKGKKNSLPSSPGFTLFELVIAITLLSLVTLLIGSGFRLGLRAWEQGESETEWTQRFRVLTGLLSQQIKSAYPYEVEVDDKKVVAFSGESDSIVFVTTLTDSSYGGFKWVRYSFKDGTLFYKEGLLPDKEFLEKISGDEEVIDSNIKEIALTYFSPDEDEWKDSWDFGEKLPGAVRVKIPYFQSFQISIPMASEGEKGNARELT